MATPPARLGIRQPLLARYTAAGWVADGLLIDAAANLLSEIARGPDPGGARSRLAAILESDPAMPAALLEDADLAAAAVAVTGASKALSEAAAADPTALRAAAAGRLPGVDRPDPDDGLPAASARLRDTVRRTMLGIAVGDLTGRLSMPEVGRALSDLADGAAGAALAAAERITGRTVPLAIIAMGKWGGRELNYASDIDVLFVYEGADAAGADARRIAERFMAILDGAGNGAFRVDADLRPEGRQGPLARSLASYRAYWERWAETWEMQALLKARPAAGDAALGAAFIEAAEPFVFPETLGAEAVREIRSMKARAEQVTAGAGVEIKRGVGGIRDVEFAVQLLQLVHGRSDPALRGANTLEALTVLGEGGYVRPDDAATLADAYHWLRNVEHRLQLFGLNRSHTLPSDPSGLERVAKAMGYRDTEALTAVAAFDQDLVRRRAAVRTIHERLFYRPLLEAFAASPAVRLTDEGAARQLAALGYADTDAARRAFADLTTGLSRRSRLMQQMLPLMLDWLSVAPDPDLGLSQLRLLVTTTPDNAGLIAALRDNPATAERLCTLLGTSRLLGKLVDRIPASLARLGADPATETPPDAGALAAEAHRLVEVRTDPEERITALRRFAQGHLLWIAGDDLLGAADHRIVGRRLSDVDDALAAAALTAAVRRTARSGRTPPAIAVIAMGKWGGGELNYASDLDALLVHAPGDEQAIAAALEVAERFVSTLDAVTADGPGRGIDLDLRPEGKRGPLIRSIDSYRAYYERWAETWEFQALLRARPVAGDSGLAASFMELVGPLAHRSGFGEPETAAVRAMKARTERERIPTRDDPDFHMKLGRGGMADVEWTVQLLQLRHAAGDPRLRSPQTLTALDRLVEAGFLDEGDGAALRAAYAFCATVRNRLFLQAGRRRDSLPSDPLEVTRLARSLGYEHDPRTTLREEYRRATRRARRVVDRVFYGTTGRDAPDSS
ncbi:MAG: bifunctional [glutamine synthetase] adenylyltransferase/[glutamine synthetase]-adenylyl-L-tyrosine phosphorylase [Actinobacteria bacterium]|nr:bifunctional [glutamine synthetase] adenylyltransferase/[glutamine synthetase]-adenylyl-L-tyrosine phosphorylase [Actinomycetota bacterium]MBU1492677.1 bifunctional [glutamine synthetase] adenylyltransferase/[glutamine synthetase]-adenylyl-L-tyrosine phosphorylase [Actinomycetota bacterium]